MKFRKSLIVGAAIAGVVMGVSGCASQKYEEPVGKCFGANSCKGKGACGGKDHACAGKNSCKGKGWIKMTESKCKKKKGSFQG